MDPQSSLVFGVLWVSLVPVFGVLSLWGAPSPTLWSPPGPWSLVSTVFGVSLVPIFGVYWVPSLESSVFEVPPGSLVFGVLSLQGSPDPDLWGPPWVSAIWFPQSFRSPVPSFWGILGPWSLGFHQAHNLLIPQVPSLVFGSPRNLVFETPSFFLCAPDLQVPFPGPRPRCSVPFLIINPIPGPDLNSLVMGPIP